MGPVPTPNSLFPTSYSLFAIRSHSSARSKNMSTITAAMVKDLRDRTGAGMMDF